MKEKIKKILFIIAEIGTVAWAINGMWKVVDMFHMSMNDFFKEYYGKVFLHLQRGESISNPNLFLVNLLFYFLSAVLILYLLRKYEPKN
ncbi:MAG: hypothetical protein ACP5OX_02790 [Minisyncoccia bacterium]